MNTYTLIIGASSIIILSYFFNLIAKKTHIPSVLMLIGLGMGMQALFQFDRNEIMPSLELLGVIGLIMIVLEAALDLHITKEKIPIIWRSTVLAILALVGTTFLIAYLFFQFNVFADFYTCLVYAVPLSVMSSAIVIPSVETLDEHRKEFMVIESSLSDIFGIMFFYYLLDLAEATSVRDVVKEIFFSLGLTIILSLAVGYLLIIVFQNLQSKVKLFLLVAILLVVYSAGKMFHLSSLVAILLFGLMLVNHRLFFRGGLKSLIKLDGIADITKNLHLVTLETAFVIRTFFFVVFGISVSLENVLHYKVILLSGIILLGTYLLRFILLKIFVGKKINLEVFINPRGLITLLLFYAITKPFTEQVPKYMSDIILAVIIATNIIMAIALMRSGGRVKVAEELDENKDTAEKKVDTQKVDATSPPENA